MLKKRRFLIGGIVILLAIGSLVFVGLRSSATYYYSVSELMALESSAYGETVRVNGQVAPGSLEQEGQGTVLRFTIVDTEKGTSIPVVYQGVVPDAFKAGNETVVEGHLGSDGVFQAHTLMPKCPSKYVAQE